MIIHWRWLDVTTQSNTGMVSVRVGAMGACLRFLRRVPVDHPQLAFVRKTQYRLRFIVHPGGGNAMRVVCEECGADYPFGWQMQTIQPCANCAVDRESGVRVNVGEWRWEKVKSV